LKVRFNELVIKDYEQSGGQIAFCTFHQSFSYEDFIEGIKPKSNQGVLTYEVKDGIFKEISRLASDKSIGILQKVDNITRLKKEEVNEHDFFKLSLGEANNPDDKEIYEYCRDYEVISLGFGEGLAFTGLNQSQIKEKYHEKWPDEYGASKLKDFIHKINIGDYVVISKGNQYIRAFGKITGEYMFDDSTPIRFTHFRNVDWIFVDEEIPVDQFYKKNFSQVSLYSLNKSEMHMEFFEEKQKLQGPEEESKFVLIIDEINRGNVSQIFGELITLIEPDKRKGSGEEIRLQLPYSKSEFSVPSNLYIVGTMNTADRSVEALDTALRRRFSFEEMQSRPELLKPECILYRLWLIHKELEWNNEKWIKIENSFLLFFDASIRDRAAYENLDGEEQKRDISSDLEKLLEFNNPLRLDLLLQAMNSRIEKLLDKDHQIGHAYFMNVYSENELKLVFKDKIIPLLQEYFFGDYGKIGLVLGESFISRTDEQIWFASFDYENSEELTERPVYKFRQPENWSFKSIYESKR